MKGTDCISFHSSHWIILEADHMEFPLGENYAAVIYFAAIRLLS